MKKSKLFFMSLLSLSLFLVTIIPTRALESSDNTNVNDEFVQFIDDMFLNQSKAKVWNRNGEDVTASFFADVENYYNNKDYHSIRVYVHDSVDEMCIEKNKISMKDARSPFVNQTVTKLYCKPIKREGSDGGIRYSLSGEIRYNICGTYVWDRATHKITSAGNSSIESISNNFSKEWQAEFVSGSTSKEIASDRYSVKFTGTFKMRAKYSEAGMVMATVDLGNFNGEAIGYPNDEWI